MELIHFDTKKSLEELEKVEKQTYRRGNSMVSRSNKLRKIALKDLSAEDLCSMIVQNSSLKYLVPVAIEMMNKDPLIKGVSYEGDLMNAVLTVEKKFWIGDLHGYVPMMNVIIEKALKITKTHPAEYEEYMQKSAHAINLFKENISVL